MKLKTPILIVLLTGAGVFIASKPNTTLDRHTPFQVPTAEVAVQQARIEGNPGNYTFHVTLKSDDTGCEQYADWWEIVDADGNLIYRRILGHSHVNEQPFTRSGGPVPVNQDQTVFIRGHMNKEGYGSRVLKGSVKTGFVQTTLDTGFAADLATHHPLPPSCAF